MTNIHPHQILCLEYEETKLYGEMIQVIAERSLYWVRPWALLQTLNHLDDPEPVTACFDLRQGVDLLCPKILFRVALDTEVIPILARLDSTKTENTDLSSNNLSEVQPMAHQQLQALIHRVWQAYPEAFRQYAP